MLIEAYGEHTLGISQYFNWFKKFKSGDFDVRKKNAEDHQKGLKTPNCKHFSMRMTVKRNNDSQIN